MIRRLLARHEGVLPEMAVVRIWRELVGAVSLLQTGLKVAVTDHDHAYWDMARDYFGSCLPMQSFYNPLHAIAAVRDDESNFAVLPWPNDEEDQPWWTYLQEDNDQPLKIIMRLPHGDEPKKPTPDKRALIVSKTGFMTSDDDRSFLLVQCEPDISRGKLVSVCETLKIKLLSISSKRCTSAMQPSLHLLEVEDYFKSDDKRIAQLSEKLEDPGARIICVGGYPTPPVFSKTIHPADEPFPSAPAEEEQKEAVSS